MNREDEREKQTMDNAAVSVPEKQYFLRWQASPTQIKHKRSHLPICYGLFGLFAIIKGTTELVLGKI